MASTAVDRRRHRATWLGLPAVAVFAFLAGVSFDKVDVRLPAFPPAYSDWASDYLRPDWLLWWIVGDTTEATLYKSALGGVLMIGGAAFAHYGARGRSGFPLACATGLWPWVAVSAGLAVVASNLVWGWTVTAADAWQPTFAPFVSVPPAVVVMYGGGWAVAATGATLGVLLVTPISLVSVNEVCVPLGLSPVVGSVSGMCLGGALAFTLCRHLPWLQHPRPTSVSAAGTAPPDLSKAPHADPVSATCRPTWVARRVLADFTEAHFYGNEWAGAGLLLGTVVAFSLNEASVSYGSGLFPELLAAQVLAGVCGVVLWRRRWAREGWYPTFVPVVSVTPAAVLTYGGSTASILAGAVLGATVAPPMAHALARKLPGHIQPMVAYTGTMAVCTVTIVPFLDLLPGFATA